MYRMCKNIYHERKSFGVIGIICLLFFGANIFLNYATDTYATFQNLHYMAGDMISRNGRILTGGIYYLWYYLGIPNESAYYISSFFSILFLSFAIFLLHHILSDIIQSSIIRIVVSFMTIANIYIIEYFMFIEKAMFMFAILCCVLSFYFTLRGIKGKRKKCFVLALISLIIATFTYQGIIALYVILCIPFVLRYSNSLKQYIVNAVIVLANYGVSCGLNLIILTWILKSSRVHETNILDNIVCSYRGIVAWSGSTFGILPEGIFVYVLVGIIGINIIGVLGKYKGIAMWIQIVNLIIILIGTAVSSVASIIMGSGWFAPRVIYPFASIIGVYIINLYLNVFGQSENRKSFRCSQIIMCLALVILIMQYFSFHRIYIDKYMNNELDYYRCMMISEQINKYEEESNIKVKYISFYNDAHPDTQYNDLFASSDIIVSSFVTNWSDLNAINYYLDTNYVRKEGEQKINDYFADKDWKIYSDEQLVFVGDVLHLCVY